MSTAFYGHRRAIRQMGYYTMLLIENDRDAIYQAVKSWNMSGLITITFPWQDYHCQQSAEKAIKAVIVSLHWPTGIPKKPRLNQIYISIPDGRCCRCTRYHDLNEESRSMQNRQAFAE